MTEIAGASRVHVKAILNLTIPKDCQPLRNINTLEVGVNTDHKHPERVNAPSENRLEKLKPCLNLLFGTIDLGLAVIKEIVRSSLSQNQLQKQILRSLSKPVNLVPLDL